MLQNENKRVFQCYDEKICYILGIWEYLLMEKTNKQTKNERSKADSSLKNNGSYRKEKTFILGELVAIALGYDSILMCKWTCLIEHSRCCREKKR